MDEAEGLRQLVVFLSYENAEYPRQLAERMLKELALLPVAVGVDALTGGCEVRLYWHPETQSRVRRYLKQHAILHDLSTR